MTSINLKLQITPGGERREILRHWWSCWELSACCCGHSPSGCCPSPRPRAPAAASHCSPVGRTNASKASTHGAKISVRNGACALFAHLSGQQQMFQTEDVEKGRSEHPRQPPAHRGHRQQPGEDAQRLGEADQNLRAASRHELLLGHCSPDPRKQRPTVAPGISTATSS